MRESNIEFAEGHKYQQYSAIQIQPNDIWLNVIDIWDVKDAIQLQWQLFLIFSFFPVQTFFKRSVSFDFVSY